MDFPGLKHWLKPDVPTDVPPDSDMDVHFMSMSPRAGIS